MYPLTDKLKGDLKGVIKTPEDEKLVEDVLEAFGELEHDPSLVWPNMFEDIHLFDDPEVEARLHEVNRALDFGADVLREVIGYIIEGRATD
jgi:hypothetical protein